MRHHVLVVVLAMMVGGCGSAATQTAGPPSVEPPSLVVASPSTVSPTPEVTAEPTPRITEAPAFVTISFAGKDDETLKLALPEGVPAIATITNNGAGPFDASAYNKAHDTMDFIASGTGSYAGTALFNIDFDTASIAVQSSGSWTITVSPITAARRWDPTTNLSGKGADVIWLVRSSSGPTTATVTYKSSDFVIVGTCDGHKWTTNQTARPGSSPADIQIPGGTLLIAIRSLGQWSFTPPR